jgi:type II secretory pathway pseudopilin PulG
MTLKKKIAGFSIIELTISLVFVGLVGVMVWSFLPRLKALPIFAQANADSLAIANRAIDGFILANGRLPCPDSSADNTGTEDCTAGSITGWLPVRTLGISLQEKVRYGVYRDPRVTPAMDMDLAVMADRFKPLYPYNIPAGTDPYVQRLNGLDFCIGLLNVTQASGTVLTASSRSAAGAIIAEIPIAYGLAVAGKTNADNAGIGNVAGFDGSNSVAGKFEMQGAAKTAAYDDDTRTVGSAELFERLGCTQKLAAVNSTARTAYVAYDVDQVAAMYVRFRTFQVKVSELDNSMVDTARNLAITDLAVAIAQMAVAIAGGFETFGAGAFAIATGVAAIAMASYSLEEAVAAIPPAAQDLADAHSMKNASDNFKAQTNADLVTAVARMKAADAKGILP